ncbi:hypothetical protein AgCh_028540 [Apium graveolens]
MVVYRRVNAYNTLYTGLNIMVCVVSPKLLTGFGGRHKYDFEDSNLKFLPALPEKWEFKVTSIRDNYQLDMIPLDGIYGVLKTHELEMEQKNKRKRSKSRPVALKVEEKPKEKARRKSYCKGKTIIAKSNTESSNSDDDSNPDTESDIDSDHNNNEDMDQMAALLVKSFKKMVYKNFKKGRRFSRKGSSSSNSDKRNNIRDTDWKEARSGKPDKSKERCYNCDGLGHFIADCKKPKGEKKQALISRKRNRDDSSNSDGINYALMENADAETNTAELKVPQSTLTFDTDDICELRIFLKTLHISFRDQTLENNRIKSENFVLKKRDDYLETELLSMLKFQKERDNERQILEKDYWGSGLGYSARSNSDKKSGKETEITEPIKTDSHVKLNKVQVKTIKFNPSVKMLNLFMRKKQLKQKLKDLHMKDKRKKSRKTRNGKDCSTASTPMATATKLDLNTGSSIDITNYRGMIGSLLYLIANRPDIMYATCFCARFQVDPREPHLLAVKRIFKYLEGCKIDRKSTSGSYQFLGGRLVSWYNKKQKSISTSTTEAEYIAAESCCAQILWMKNQLLDYRLDYSSIPIYYDNQSAIAMTGNPVHHSMTKHISIRYHFIREHVEADTVELIFVLCYCS